MISGGHALAMMSKDLSPRRPTGLQRMQAFAGLVAAWSSPPFSASAIRPGSLRQFAQDPLQAAHLARYRFDLRACRVARRAGCQAGGHAREGGDRLPQLLYVPHHLLVCERLLAGALQDALPFRKRSVGLHQQVAPAARAHGRGDNRQFVAERIGRHKRLAREPAVTRPVPEQLRLGEKRIEDGKHLA